MSRHSDEGRTGRLGRAGRLAVASAYSGLVPALILASPSARDALGPLRFLAVALLLLTVWLWVRLPFTGVAIKGDDVRVRGWWSRRVFKRGDLERFRVQPYGGPFYYLAWAIDSGPFESGELHAEFEDGSAVRLGGLCVVGARRTKSLDP